VSLRDYLLANPPPDDAFTQSLSGVADRANLGEDFFTAVRELLDEVAVLPRPDLVQRALVEAPAPTGDARHDAYLAALAEYLAMGHSVERPSWCSRPERFLDRFWFVSDTKGFRALAVAESPAPFRRRGIFIAAGSLHRC
jgi:hypothetical protein